MHLSQHHIGFPVSARVPQAPPFTKSQKQTTCNIGVNAKAEEKKYSLLYTTQDAAILKYSRVLADAALLRDHGATMMNAGYKTTIHIHIVEVAGIAN
jgi:hypothetical protein